MFYSIEVSIVVGLYVGAVAIVYGAYTYFPPRGLAIHDGDVLPVAPVVACTFVVSAQFFCYYAAVVFDRTFTQFSGQKFSSHFEEAMLTAAKARRHYSLIGF